MDLSRLFVPRDPALQRLAARIHGDRPDLRAAFPVADGTAFWQWLGTYGLLEHAEVAAHYPPLPPAGLRATACGGATMATHLYTGAEDCRMLLELAALLGDRPPDELGTILDFGCGCGRALRWFAQALPDAALHGVDVRRASVEWCAANLPGAYACTGTMPPLPFADASFDLVYALSVFSHLNLAQQHAWMRELLRVTKPTGLVLASTLLGGCSSTVVLRDRPIAPGLPSHPAANAAAIVGIGTAAGETMSRDLVARRDTSLARRPAERLGMTDQWQSRPVPDVTRIRRLQFARSSEAFTYFESERTGGLRPAR
jgi:SAM-dependent methyltransferase